MKMISIEKEKISEIEKFLKKEKCINPFKRGDNVSEYLKYFDEIYAECFKNTVVPIVISPIDIIDTFYRARNYTENVIEINDPKYYSYPPIKRSKFMRANFPGFPVFYCSNNTQTAIEEQKKYSPGEKKFLLAKWRKSVQKDIFRIMPLFPNKEIYTDYLKILIKGLKIKNIELRNALIKMIVFIGDCIMNTDKTYISAYFSHKFIYNSNLIDIIVYPSCIIGNTGANFAISPKIIDNKKLKLDRVYKVLIENKNVKPFEVGIFKNGSVNWQKINEMDKFGDDYLTYINDFKQLSVKKLNLPKYK